MVRTELRGHKQSFCISRQLAELVLPCVELGKADDGEVFDPSTLDPNRCESCYGAETEDLKWDTNTSHTHTHTQH